jgi:glycosyltransferase involved in cell wall biosynthesis/ADP-heptose:LPS heptosyltransferase
MGLSRKIRTRGGPFTRATLALLSQTLGKTKPLPEKFERILVTVVAGIGDCLLATPAIRSLRKRYPEARIVLLTNRRSEGLLKGWPEVDEIIAFDIDYLFYSSKQRWYRPRGLIHIWRTLRHLRRERFDLAVNLKEINSLRGAVLMGLWLTAGGARYRAGRDTEGRAAAFHIRTPESELDRRHAVTKNLAVATALGCEADTGPISIHLSQDDRHAADSFLSGRGSLTAPLVALHPWVKDANRRWPLAHWAKVAENLSSRLGATSVVLGGSQDVAAAEGLAGATSGNVLLATGALTLRQTAALIERCDLFLGVLSGPLHMAAAVGTPIVACYASRYGDLYPPYTDPARFKVLTPKSPGAPLSEVPPEAVIDGAQQLLKKGKSPPPVEVLPWFSAPEEETAPARPRSVAHIITRLDRGGSPQNTILTVLSLDPSRYRATLISGLTTAPTPMVTRLFDRQDIEFTFVPSLIRPLSPFSDLRALWSLYRICRQKRFDMVHTHGSKAGIIGRWAAWLAGCKLMVHTCHGSVFSGYAGRFMSRLFVSAERLTARITEHIITLTPEGMEEFLSCRIASEHKFSTIPSGVEIESLEARSGDNGTAAREAMGLPLEGPIIGSVGRLDWIKGYDLLVEASALVLKKRPDVWFAVAGDGHERSALEEQIHRLRVADRWRLIGWRDELNLIYRAFDLSVLPSRNEGMGRAAVEAMTCGLAVVATAVGGLPSVVEDEVTGILVPPEDPRALADAILKLLENEATRRKMEAEGPRRAQELFSKEVMIKRIDKLYTRLFETIEATQP